MPVTLFIPNLVMPTSAEAVVNMFGTLLRVQDRMEQQHRRLLSELTGKAVPSEVREASVRATRELEISRQKIEWLRSQLRVAATWARRLRLVSGDDVREAGLGALPVGAAIAYAILALGLSGAIAIAGTAAVRALSAAVEYHRVVNVYLERVRAMPSGAPMPAMPGMPSSGWSVEVGPGGLGLIAVIGLGLWFFASRPRGGRRVA